MFLNEGFHGTVARSVLCVWPGNPRKTIDPVRLAELAASIEVIGIQQPLVVRPSGDGFEVIAGQRRFLAAGIAGLETVPCIVRLLDDEQALEVSIAENAARTDVAPIEEAESIEAYLKLGRTIEQAAARFGHAVAWVQARRRLLGLTAFWRERVAAETCPLRHAELLARFGVELQDKMAALYPAAATLPSYENFEHDVRFALQLLRLAPFPISDASYPGGECDACPSRSDKQRELFAATVRDVDVTCLDLKCWNTKLDHRWSLALKDAKKRKLRVLATNEVRLYGDGSPYFDAPWVSAEAAERYKLAPTAVVRAPSGAVVELVAREAFEKARDAAFTALKNSRPSSNNEDEDEDQDPDESPARTRRQAAMQRRHDAQIARRRSIVGVMRGPNARRLIVELSDNIVETYYADDVREAFGLPEDEPWPSIIERSSEAELLQLALMSRLIDVHDDESLDELIARLGEPSSELEAATAAIGAQIIEQFAPAIEAAKDADELGAVWLEIRAEDHRASLDELGRRWTERAAALGLKPAAIKKLRKSMRAPPEPAAA